MADDVTPIRPRYDRKRLPHNAAAEASILGGIILRNEVLDELPTLETEAFFLLKHKIVFAAMRDLRAKGAPLDVVTLEGEIERQGKLDAIGGIAFLGDLTLIVPTADNVLAYAADVETLYRNRRAIVLLASALERAENWPHDAIELVLETAGELQRIDEGRLAQQNKKKLRWAIPMDEFFGTEEPDDDDSSDWIIRDLIPRAEPVLFGGPMKAGKTWAALDLAIAAALGESWLGRFNNTVGKPIKVLGLFLEDNKRRLGKRLWELARGRGRHLSTDLILGHHLRVSRAPLRLPNATDQRQLISEIKDWGAEFVLVDNLTRVMKGDPNKTGDASDFTKCWSEIGEATGSSMLFLHHARKPPSSNDQREVDPFEQLRGSGDFGATARNIIVTLPLRVEGEMLAEVRMRGNLDLTVESFVLGFERVHDGRRWSARLTDRGEVDAIKDNASTKRQAEKKEKKRAEKARESVEQRERALLLVNTQGFVTQGQLADSSGCGATKSGAILNDMVASGVLRKDKYKGYVLADAERQIPLPGAGS